jgi:uncharacterized protein
MQKDEINNFCQRWGVRELALFGSVLRDDFSSDSDIDVLVDFEVGYTLDTLLDMKDELETLFGRPVDLIVKRVVESDSNPYRRQAILNSAQVIY